MHLLFAVAFTTGLAGLFHAPWWSAVVGSCLLMLYLIADEQNWELPANGAEWATAQTLSSILIGAVAGPLSFFAGKFAAITWGV